MIGGDKGGLVAPGTLAFGAAYLVEYLMPRLLELGLKVKGK
jgi:hypothetical protein